jgi:hypothetical protein
MLQTPGNVVTPALSAVMHGDSATNTRGLPELVEVLSRDEGHAQMGPHGVPGVGLSTLLSTLGLVTLGTCDSASHRGFHLCQLLSSDTEHLCKVHWALCFLFVSLGHFCGGAPSFLY